MYIKTSICSGFEIINWIEDQFQSSPKLVGIWTVLRCIFVPNLEIVTSIGGELWHGQAQNGVNFDFVVQFELEGHNQSSHKPIGIFTKVFYISGSNLVILAEMGDELWRRQARDWRTDRHSHRQTDAGNYNTRRPNWPRVKMSPGMPKEAGSLNGPLCAYLIRQNLHNRTRPRSWGYECPCHISKWSVKIYGPESINGDFPCAKLENAKKNCQIFFLPIMTNPRTYMDEHV